ncbi:MAG: hypothetical protein PWR24_1325, partial [Desulfonauticus sp.]|nr:hypothetical protein [Desulfonauticus sp.]
KSLVSLFSSIPYTNYTKNDLNLYKGFYASIIFTYVSSLGFRVIGEDVTNKGKGEALKQIKERDYAQKYLNKSKEIYLVGIEFSSEEKNIVNFEWEELGMSC